MHEKTLAELSQALQSKALSSVELTQHYLKRIEQLDGNLNSYIPVTAESALEQAAAADARIAALKAEIARTEAKMEYAVNHKAIAEALFKR